jgi:hypothetical protein
LPFVTLAKGAVNAKAGTSRDTSKDEARVDLVTLSDRKREQPC